MALIGNQLSTVAFLTDTFSGGGGVTSFTMAVAPAGTASILVAITGVVQAPSTYSVIGTTLTFSSAPPSGTNNISVRYLGIPASGVTATAYRTVQDFTATAAQTSFTPSSYTPGYINVYRNGVRLGAADYTATNGTTVVLAVGANLNDLITTESFYVSSVLNAVPATGGAINGNLTVVGSLLGNVSITGNASVAGNLLLGTTTQATGAMLTVNGSIKGTITSGTAVASTSGTSIDFTGIPSWAKRITIMFNSVSTSGTGVPLIQLGTSGGIVTSGYLGSCCASNSLTGTTRTNGFGTSPSVGASDVLNGSLVLTLLNAATGTWTISGVLAFSSGAVITSNAGSVVITNTLTTVRITTTTGTDTFDLGSINILYEG